MHSRLLWRALPVALQTWTTLAIALNTQEPTLGDIARRYTKRTSGGLHVPIVQQETPSMLRRRGVSSTIGLGDVFDVAYTVLLTVGGVTTPMILDTGSSDLWVLSDACLEGCNGDAKLYPQASFNSSAVGVQMFYGDSQTGTFASGLIGEDKVDLAGLTLNDQYFAAINRTNTTVIEIGAAGIFGLGFPINSVVWNNLFVNQNGLLDSVESVLRREEDENEEEKVPFRRPNIKFGSPFPTFNFRRRKFPSLPGILGKLSLLPSSSSSRHESRQTALSILYTAFASWSTVGPFLPRLLNQGMVTQPMYSVTLQRDTIEVGGNVGMLSVGELPSGVNEGELTWVPVRGYNYTEGGIPGPPNAPGEVYPITWEVMLDDVYLDGEKLPRSSLSASSIQLSSLVDTGNSLIRGPADIVSLINSRLGSDGIFPCSQPHTLAFGIGGKLFPVDPRDLAIQAFDNSVDSCYATLASTDPPRVGGYQFSWSLGTPFLKGVLSSYYYGNLSYPSQDKPRMGFLSTVPSNAGDLMKAAVIAASNTNGNFPGISQAAPSGTLGPALTDSNGIPQATSTIASSSSARSHLRLSISASSLLSMLFCVCFAGWALGTIW